MLKSRSIILWLLFGLALRCCYVLFVHNPSELNFSDMANYIRMAGDVEQGNWHENLFFQPVGFSSILVLIRKVFGDWVMPLAILQAIFSTLTLYFLWRVAEETWGEKVGRYSLYIGIFHLPWILYNGFALAETFFTFFLSVLLFLGQKIFQRSAQSLLMSALWSLSFLAAFWLKGSHVFLGPLFLLGIFFYFRKISFLKTILPVSLIVGIGLLSHGLFTLSKTGKFLISSSAGGLNFVEGKCPSKRNVDSRGIVWQSPLYYQMQNNTERVWDHPFTDSSYFMKAGLKCIEDNPLVLISSLESIPYLFYGNTLWPANQLKEASLVRFYELMLTLLMVPGLMMLLFLNWGKSTAEEIIVWIIPTIALFTCVYIFKSEIRFRVPFDVFLIPMSVRGWFLLRNSQRHIQQL